MTYYTTKSTNCENTQFARYAEIMTYYTSVIFNDILTLFARYAEIMTYYTKLKNGWERN